jgi:hypothetical protein
MIDFKQAVEIAVRGLTELVGDELADREGIQLEELELTDDSKHWNVTLSYPTKKRQDEEISPTIPESVAKFLRGAPKRKWKTFKIDSQDGRLVAMKLPGSSSAMLAVTEGRDRMEGMGNPSR